MRRFFIKSFPVILLLALSSLARASEAPSADVLFARKVLPLFKERCIACHGEDPKKKLKGEFDMRTRADLLKGGESEEPSIVAGKPQQSPLYLASTREHEDDWEPMPPKENDKLSAKEIGYIKDWIAGGAPWPDAKRITALLGQKDPWAAEDGLVVKTSGGLSREWTDRKYTPKDLWAYQSIKRPKLPMKSANSIDTFINVQLPIGLQPAPLADRLTLIRRATFDLTGLPPTPVEIDNFIKDLKPGAYGRLLERLLGSPHYGEQWGRHWLDVVRYADSGGFANDFERPNAWRYRDYVVRSFNQDKPYDQFVREQIAGDEIDPKSTENKIAVGFLRMGPWEQTGMSVAAVTRQQFLDDVTDSVGQVFLGQVLMCV